MNRKPGCLENGYILYCESLMNRLQSDTPLGNSLINQFESKRDVSWAFRD